MALSLFLVMYEGNAGPSKEFGPEASKVLSKSVAEEGSCPVKEEIATFAAGCFWGVELSFQRIPGVIKTRVGYTGGHKANPTYQEVCSGATGHTEAVEVTFNPNLVSFEELLTVLWDRMDPTTLNRQGNDVGTQYRSGIYYHSDEQKKVAEASLAQQQSKYASPIVTEIMPASTFWQAEDYHQRYLEKGGQCSAKGDSTAIRCYG